MECLLLGGGILLIPIYTHIFNSSEKEARATTVFCILPMVVTTAIIYGRSNYINWSTGFLCAIGGIIGSFVGSYFLNILSSKYLKIIYIVLLFYSGLKLIF